MAVWVVLAGDAVTARWAANLVTPARAVYQVTGRDMPLNFSLVAQAGNVLRFDITSTRIANLDPVDARICIAAALATSGDFTIIIESETGDKVAEYQVRRTDAVKAELAGSSKVAEQRAQLELADALACINARLGTAIRFPEKASRSEVFSAYAAAVALESGYGTAQREGDDEPIEISVGKAEFDSNVDVFRAGMDIAVGYREWFLFGTRLTALEPVTVVWGALQEISAQPALDIGRVLVRARSGRIEYHFEGLAVAQPPRVVDSPAA
jgi:hypothetical protein